MRSIGFVLLVAGIMGACRPRARSEICPPISDATRVVVSQQNPGSYSEYAITDSARIRQLIAFANARRTVFRPSLSTMPAPKLTASFYDNDRFVGTIGAGPGFFFVSCPNSKGIRNAAATEMKEFSRLLASTDRTANQGRR